MRYFSLLIITAMLLPLSAFGSRLVSVSGSKETRESYTILTLHFDQEVPYTVQEIGGGRSLRLDVPGCRIEAGAEKELTEFKNSLFKDILVFSKANGLTLEFQFKVLVKSLVWETRNPFSLVMDISSLEDAVQSVAKKTAVSKPSSKSNKKSESSSTKTQNKQSKTENKELARYQRPASKSQQQTDTKPETRQVSQSELSLEAHFDKGLSLHQAGKLEAALEHLQKASKDPLLYAQSTAEMAVIYHQLGRDKNEIAAWEELFNYLQERGYQLPDDEYSVSSLLAGGLSPGNDAPGEREISSSGWSGTIVYPLILAVFLMVGAIVWLHRRVGRLQAIVGGHIPVEKPSNVEKPEPEENIEIPSETAPESGAQDQELHQSKEAEASGEQAVPWGGEEEAPSRAAEEKAMEVIALSEQGYSIQEIAEKLGLGQDEVRLILNLQREEKASAEES